MELHERVKYLRKSLDKSQAEFAAELGTSRDAINNIECNRLKRPEQKEPLLKLMCQKYGIREQWLIDGEGEMVQSVERDGAISAFMVDVMHDSDTVFRKRLINVLCQLDVAEWELLEKMALKLVAEYKKEDQAEA